MKVNEEKADNLLEVQEVNDWVTQNEAAEKSGKSLAAINNLIRRGRIASKEIYGRTLVSLSEVMTYNVQRGRPPKAKAEKQVSKKGGKK